MGFRRRAVALFFALSIPLTAFVAGGQPKPKAPATYDPENVTAISQYMETVAKGMSLYAVKDTTGAIDTFRKAQQLAPRNPLANLLLAEAYLSTNNYGEADASLAQALENADAKHSHVLFLTADVAERQKKWEAARVAWQAYNEHAARLGVDGGAFPQSAAERLKAIQKVIDLEKAYAGVRERIAAEKSDAGKPPPAPAKR